MLLRNLKPLIRRKSHYSFFGILSRSTTLSASEFHKSLQRTLSSSTSSYYEMIRSSSINSTKIGLKHVQLLSLPNIAKFCTFLGQIRSNELLDNDTSLNVNAATTNSTKHSTGESAHELFDDRSTLLGQESAHQLFVNVHAATNGDRCTGERADELLHNRSTLLGQESAHQLLGNVNTATNCDKHSPGESAHQLFDNSSTLLGQESAPQLFDNVNAATNSDKHSTGEKADELLDNSSTLLGQKRANELLDNVNAATNSDRGGLEAKHRTGEMVDFTQIHINKLPTVLIMGRPNVGKSALFNRLIRRREALVYNTPTDHVTRDIREGVAKLGNLRFRVLDSAGIEAEASSGSVLRRTAQMTGNVLSRTQLALLLVDARDGVLPMDLDVGKWLRKNAPGMKTIVVMNKAESLDDCDGTLAAAAGEAYNLGFGDPIALSAETGLGMAELHETLRPLLEEYVVQNNLCDDEIQENDENDSSEDMESKLPLQLAIVGRPNVGKSTLLNTILQEDRVLVGPEAGLTRDSIRAEFQYEGRTVYLVDTAGWLERTKQQEKGPASLSIMQSRKHLMRAHVIVLVLDAEEIAKDRRSMKHVEVVIARRAVEEGRGLVVIVNKMDLLRGKENSKFYKSVIEAVPQEIQSVIPQVTGIPVVFVSALEGKSQIAVMNQVVETYEKWCLRLPTARLNRWLRKVMSRHSWKDQAAQPKIKYFTQVKARPPTFIAFMSGKTQLSDTDLRFLTRSLKEDFDLGGIPVRILQRTVEGNDRTKTNSKNKQSANRTIERVVSDKRTILEGD